MTVWIYLLKLNNLSPSLYAFTNNKSYHKRFEKERNMNVFIKKEIEMTDEEYYTFSSRHGNLNLKICMFETYKETDAGYHREVVDIVCPYSEEYSVILNFDYINKEIGKSTSEVGLRFNEQVMSALNTLYYYDFLKQKLHSEEYQDVWDYNKYYFDGINNLSESPFGFNYDYLAVFIKMYGYTLNL